MQAEASDKQSHCILLIHVKTQQISHNVTNHTMLLQIKIYILQCLEHQKVQFLRRNHAGLSSISTVNSALFRLFVLTVGKSHPKLKSGSINAQATVLIRQLVEKSISPESPLSH